MIETYQIKEKGYHPFLIRDGWQVAQLNYIEDQHISNITKLDVHLQTDETFILLQGKAILIVAAIENDEPIFELELMKPKIIYNIPQGVWHNIAMEEDSEVLIAEKSNTHIADFEYFELSPYKKEELMQMVRILFASIEGNKTNIQT